MYKYYKVRLQDLKKFNNSFVRALALKDHLLLLYLKEGKQCNL